MEITSKGQLVSVSSEDIRTKSLYLDRYDEGTVCPEVLGCGVGEAGS